MDYSHVVILFNLWHIKWTFLPFLSYRTSALTLNAITFSADISIYSLFSLPTSQILYQYCKHFTSLHREKTNLCMAKSHVPCWEDQIDDTCKVAGKSGDTRAEIQYGSSLCGFWGGSFCESWEQHHQPRGSSASQCAGVGAHFESQLYSDWSNFRSSPL